MVWRPIMLLVYDIPINNELPSANTLAPIGVLMDCEPELVRKERLMSAGVDLIAWLDLSTCGDYLPLRCRYGYSWCGIVTFFAGEATGHFARPTVTR